MYGTTYSISYLSNSDNRETSEPIRDNCDINTHYFNHVTRRSGTDDVITNTLDTMDIYIMPILNVDGYVYSFEEVSKPLHY